MRHPYETMDDLTDVSGDEAMERRNTIMVTKTTEVRSKTVVGVIVGLIVGVGLYAAAFLVVGAFWATPFLLVPLGVAPWVVSGVVRDRTQQARYRRLMLQYRSARKGVAGRVWFPNSLEPEDLGSFRRHWFLIR